mmetsp:Transcript_18244/g.30268  ORF Transcript_18244/g.30268 Transcript_18244/m.30268 type:complete len:220 (-) Transcript_18244:179-838(-)
MKLVFENGLVHIERLLPSCPHRGTSHLVTRLHPQRNSILRLANRHNSTADLITLQINGFANHTQDSIEPPFIRSTTLTILLGYRQHEFTTLLVGWIFPHGLDAFSKDVVVRIERQLGGRFEIIINGPKVTHSFKIAALFQIVLPIGSFWSEARIVKPHDPFLMHGNDLDVAVNSSSSVDGIRASSHFGRFTGGGDIRCGISSSSCHFRIGRGEASSSNR